MTKEDYNVKCKEASKEMIETISKVLSSSNGVDIFYKNATISENCGCDLHGISMYGPNKKELCLTFDIIDPDNNTILSALESAATMYYTKCDNAYRDYEKSQKKEK